VKTLVVKIPEALAAEIETEAKSTRKSKSEVVRQRLERGRESGPRPLSFWDVTHDQVEKLEPDPTLPPDFSARKKHYLRKWGFGKRRHR
jgi:Ribbon-helix-helix protein, copG family